MTNPSEPPQVGSDVASAAGPKPRPERDGLSPPSTSPSTRSIHPTNPSLSIPNLPFPTMNPTSHPSSVTPEGYSGPALGQPIGGGGHSHATSTSTTTTGGAALAAGAAGDYTPNPFGSTVQHSGGEHSSSHEAAALKGALGGSGGEGRDTTYGTTHPQSGFQAQGEAQPHVAGRGGAAAAGLTGAALGSGTGEFGSHGHSAENASRRDDGLLNQTEHRQPEHISSVTGKDTSAAFTDGHTGPHSSGAGVAGLAGAGVGGAGLAGAAAHHGHHSNEGALSGQGHHSGVTPQTKNDTSSGPEDLTVGGFNPKVAGMSISPPHSV